jgi:hypothetical protein
VDGLGEAEANVAFLAGNQRLDIVNVIERDEKRYEM